MTTAQAVGAVSSEAAEWYAIDWPTTFLRRLRDTHLESANVAVDGTVSICKLSIASSMTGSRSFRS
jgi:hypothetical protein